MFASHRNSSGMRAFADVPRISVAAGRVLLLLTAIVLAFTPITEHLWTWDRFLRGGQDVELTLMAILALACLILVLAQRGKRALDLLLGLQRVLARFRCRAKAFLLILSHSRTRPGRRRATMPVLGTYGIPLQI